MQRSCGWVAPTHESWFQSKWISPAEKIKCVCVCGVNAVTLVSVYQALSDDHDLCEVTV